MVIFFVVNNGGECVDEDDCEEDGDEDVDCEFVSVDFWYNISTATGFKDSKHPLSKDKFYSF